MAQVCGDSSFDYGWDRAHSVASGILKKAADIWAARGPNALSSDAVLAVFLRIYLSEWTKHGGLRAETRNLDAWLQLVVTAGEELIMIRPNVDSNILAKVIGMLETELSMAVNEWAIGDPESPATAEVLNVFEHILFEHKLTRRPGNPKMPTSLVRGNGLQS